MQSPYLAYSLLVKQLKQDKTGFKNIKLAILADFASQHYVKAIRAALISSRIDATIWEADYNSIDSSIISEHSELYQASFDYVVLIPSPHKLIKEFSHSSSPAGFADLRLRQIQHLLEILASRTRSRIIFTNYQELDDGVFGNYANKTAQSFLFQIRKINFGLMQLAIDYSNLYIADAESLYSSQGNALAFDPKLYVHGDLIYTLDFIAILAQSTSKIIAAIQGSFKKCVVVDLDNTMWGGIIGDDGIENIQIGELGIGKAFTGLQNWLLSLKNRGIILAVSSKNTDSVAREVFEKHPGMTLRMRDISVFAVNWETKVDNIRFIQSVLNIGFDSMVFLDDNPFERDIVRQNIADITVPELPEDPAEYLFYLQSLNLFETASVSTEDAGRTKQYQEEAGRRELQKSFVNEDEFLAGLDMKAVIKPVDSFTCPRVAQLTQRSNQFNLRTVRYTDDDVKKIMVNPDFKTITVSLADKYGDYGLISAVFLEKKSADTIFVDTWIMSCRVLKRGVEWMVLDEIVHAALESGFKYIDSEYLATAKNGMVRDHYKLLGFEELDASGKYRLLIENYLPGNNYIEKTGDYVNNKRSIKGSY
ncbi:HAD-IIIC family phosphatase [Flavitalea sp.]|nr:HAD-IIIC family phosphatase [Flavitalea sp.]